MNDSPSRPYAEYVEHPPDEMYHRAEAFAEDISRRRSVAIVNSGTLLPYLLSVFWC